MTTETLASISPADHNQKSSGEGIARSMTVRARKWADVFSAMEAPEPRRGRRWLILTALSAVAFITVAWYQRKDSLFPALSLFGIVAFHELGHYIAMKRFGYKNLFMVFIPGFGAGVGATSCSDSLSWRESAVALAGPLPGIYLGALILLLNGIWDSHELRMIGVFSVAINLANLIPLTPLDGGKFLSGLTIHRRPWATLLFNLLGPLILIFYFKGWGLSIGVFFASRGISAFMRGQKITYAAQKVGREWRERGRSIPSTLEPELAIDILETLSPLRRYKNDAGSLAENTKDVFQLLNARRPSKRIVLGLVSLYALAWVISVPLLLHFVPETLNRLKDLFAN